MVGTVGLVVVLLLLGVLAINRASSNSTGPASLAKVAAKTNGGHPEVIDCSLVHRRPSIDSVIAFLGSHGITVAPGAPVRTPADACGAASFTDASSPGTNVITAYPSYADAHAAARREPNGVPAFSAGVYLLVLDRSLAPQLGLYLNVMVMFMKISDPLTPLATLVPPNS